MIVRTCCVSLKLSYFSLLESVQIFLSCMTSPFCTTAVENELCKSFLPNFAWTVKFVAKILMGMVWEWFPMYFWCCALMELFDR